MRSSQYWMLVTVTQLLMQMACSVKNSSCAECGGDWVRLEDEPFCYQFAHFDYADRISFTEGQKYCQNQSATLPIVKTNSSKKNLADFYLFIADTSSATNDWVYIGLHQIGNEWMWVDNTTLADTIDDFIGSLPTNPSGGAVVLGKTAKPYSVVHLTTLTQHRCCQKQCPVQPSTTNSQSATNDRQDEKTQKQNKTTAQGGGLGTGLIIGIAAGGAVLLLLLIVGVTVLVKKRRGAGMPREPSSQQKKLSATVTAKDDPGASVITQDLFGVTEAEQTTDIGTKDLFRGTEADQTGIGTKELFNATEADSTSNASLNLSSVET